MSEKLDKDEKRFIQEWMKFNWNHNWGESMTMGFLLELLEKFAISLKVKNKLNGNKEVTEEWVRKCVYALKVGEQVLKWNHETTVNEFKKILKEAGVSVA